MADFLDDDREGVAPAGPEILKVRFLTAATAVCDDWDDGEHTFDVVLPPAGTSDPVPAAGDIGWVHEDDDGEYPVLCWRRGP